VTCKPAGRLSNHRRVIHHNLVKHKFVTTVAPGRAPESAVPDRLLKRALNAVSLARSDLVA
jgi:hypothetical protein